MIPSEGLSGLLVASESIADNVSVYAGPDNQIVPPAIVIRPDNPWIEPDRFCADKQHYVAIAVVSASSPVDGVRELYAIAQGIIATINGVENTPWDFESVSAPIIDETTGTAFLAASVRLTYRNEEEAS